MEVPFYKFRLFPDVIVQLYNGHADRRKELSVLVATDHVAWPEDVGQFIETVDGREAEIWVLHYIDNPAILLAWATHYRQHYCRDEDLPDLVADTGSSNADFLTNIKFLDAIAAPGPSTRTGDFGELLVADIIEYVLGYWRPLHGRLRIARTAMCRLTAPINALKSSHAAFTRTSTWPKISVTVDKGVLSESRRTFNSRDSKGERH